MQKGCFVTIEGTDGSGKSTQVKFIKEYLTDRRIDFIMLREPGGTKISEKIRELTLDTGNMEMVYTTEVLLYAASRAQLVGEVIKPALEQGKVVICDRFVDSSYAYQSYGRGIPMETVKAANQIALSGIMPEMTIFMDIPPELALSRRMRASTADRLEMEKIEFHKRVYKGYKELALLEPERIKTIDAKKRKAEVWLDIRKLLENLIK